MLPRTTASNPTMMIFPHGVVGFELSKVSWGPVSTEAVVAIVVDTSLATDVADALTGPAVPDTVVVGPGTVLTVTLLAGVPEGARRIENGTAGDNE